jgi:hypothetical protein
MEESEVFKKLSASFITRVTSSARKAEAERADQISDQSEKADRAHLRDDAGNQRKEDQPEKP